MEPSEGDPVCAAYGDTVRWNARGVFENEASIPKVREPGGAHPVQGALYTFGCTNSLKQCLLLLRQNDMYFTVSVRNDVE